MGSFAADHVIADRGRFARRRTPRRRRSPRDDWLVTHRHRADARRRPASATSTSATRCPATTARTAVAEFVEKPAADVAAAYLATGGYRWNAGMFVVRPGVLLDLLAESAPRLRRARCARSRPTRTRLDELWPTLPKIAIDHAVAEPAAAAGRVAVVPAVVRLGRHRRLRLAGRRCSAADGEPVTRARATPALVRAVDSSGLVVPAAPAGWSRWSASTTSSSSTPRTRCW